MFLDITLRRNPKLIDTAFKLHQSGLIQPDTYILDLDTIVSNGSLIKDEADKYGIKLYFMTKQFGRNPFIAAKLMELGYDGAVAVDYREAEILYQNGIKLGHLGHLVQLPSNTIKVMLGRKPEVITVYSINKAMEISKAAVEMNINQKIMLRIIDTGDTIFPGQQGGFYIKDIIHVVEEIMCLPNIELYGLTSFPCFLVDNVTGNINETNNLWTIMKAKDILWDKFGIKIKQINTPSVTCTSIINKIAELGGTHGEPGHGLLGTTPLHALKDQVEIPAIVYVSEISHNLDDAAYCYGGGYYRRAHMEAALVGRDMKNIKKINADAPFDNNIDYYIGLKENANVGDTAVFAFRTQIFVTRSEVAVVEGISTDNPHIVGIYDSLGKYLRCGN